MSQTVYRGMPINVGTKKSSRNPIVIFYVAYDKRTRSGETTRATKTFKKKEAAYRFWKKQGMAGCDPMCVMDAVAGWVFCNGKTAHFRF